MQKQVDEDPTLLLTEVCTLVEVTETVSETVMMHEDKVQPKLQGSMDKA